MNIKLGREESNDDDTDVGDEDESFGECVELYGVTNESFLPSGIQTAHWLYPALRPLAAPNFTSPLTPRHVQAHSRGLDSDSPPKWESVCLSAVNVYVCMYTQSVPSLSPRTSRSSLASRPCRPVLQPSARETRSPARSRASRARKRADRSSPTAPASWRDGRINARAT